MLWTLQKYIFREMGKSFLLTSAGLIAVIGLGGGVMNMIELEGVTALQLLKIIGLTIPIAATLTLPIAALYAATVTYGRLSADNEFVACRSGGINIHLLFLPTLVISLASAVCTFYFINFVIPDMIMNIDRFVGTDLPRIIKQRLATSERLNVRDKFVIYADDTSLVALDPRHPNDRSALRLNGVAFVEMDGENWNKFGTAESVLIEFGEQNGAVTVAANMYKISLFDAKDGRYYEQERQPIGHFALPQRIPLKIKWLTLGGLLQYGQRPEQFPKIGEELEKLRARMALVEFYRDAANAFARTVNETREYGEIVFGTAERGYRIRARALLPSGDDGRPVLSDHVQVTVVEEGVAREVTADSAALRDIPEGRPEDLRVYVTVDQNVTIHDENAPGGMIRRDRERFDSVPIPAEIIERVRRISDQELLDTSASTGMGEVVEKRRHRIIAEVGEIGREIIGELHSRFAFSLSVFVLVILGAALGIVFRGSQPLVAFGISFVPSLLVISTIIMGKQLIDKPTTTTTGVLVVWAGIALVALVDVYVMMRVVRR